MLNINPAVGQPIRSAQNYLRQIAYVHDEVPLVVPDGIFGEQTTSAVIGFQKLFGLPDTGEIDNETWDQMIVEYESVTEALSDGRAIRIYPRPEVRILPGEADRNLYPIQSILLLLTTGFDNLGSLAVTGVNDPPTTEVVKRLQSCYGMEQNGIIEKRFWNKTAGLYEAHVSVNQFLDRRGSRQQRRSEDTSVEDATISACKLD